MRQGRRKKKSVFNRGEIGHQNPEIIGVISKLHTIINQSWYQPSFEEFYPKSPLIRPPTSLIKEPSGHSSSRIGFIGIQLAQKGLQRDNKSLFNSLKLQIGEISFALQNHNISKTTVPIKITRDGPSFGHTVENTTLHQQCPAFQQPPPSNQMSLFISSRNVWQSRFTDPTTPRRIENYLVSVIFNPKNNIPLKRHEILWHQLENFFKKTCFDFLHNPCFTP